MSYPEPSDVHVLAWMQDGNTGSAAEISEALGIKKPTVYAALMRLEGRHQVKVVDTVDGPTGHPAHIFGIDRFAGLSKSQQLQLVIASQPALVRAWAGAMA